MSSTRTLFHILEKSTEWNVIKKAVRDYPNVHNARNGEGKSVLHCAAETGNLQLVTMLLSMRKIDVNAMDCNEWTALHCAASAGHFDICIALLTKGKSINVNIKNEDQNGVLVYLTRLPNKLVENKLKSYLKVLELMIQRGVDVHSSNILGEAPLHFACLRGTIYSVSFLLEHGADPNQANRKKETPLHWAVIRKEINIIKVLVEYGADPFLASTSGATPMNIGLEQNSKEIIRLMNSRALFCSEASREYAMAGNMERRIKRSKWSTVYCVLKETILFVYKSKNPKEKPFRSYDISEFNITEKNVDKQKYGKPYVFTLEHDLRCATFALSSELEKSGWIKAMATATKIKGHMANEPKPTKHNLEKGKRKKQKIRPESQKIESEEINGHIMRALEEPGNNICADCDKADPYWMLVTYGALVCFDCANIHDKLNTSPIKSLHYDPWLLSDSMQLKSNGNTNHNTKMEINIHITQKPNAKATNEEREIFIKQKYLQSTSVPHIKRQKSGIEELQGATMSRGMIYSNIYSIDQLLIALAIPKLMWNSLKSSSKIYRQLSTALDQNEDFDNNFLNTLKTTLYPVPNYSSKLLGHIIPFVRTIKNIKSSNQISLCEILFLDILRLYQDLQDDIVDLHIQNIFKWWIPQAIEILSLFKALKEYDSNILMISKFCNNSIKSMFLLTGEYLQYGNNDSGQDNNKKEEQILIIEEKCKIHTNTIRELFTEAFKNTQSYSESLTQSFSEDSTKFSSVVRVNSLDLNLKRTSSYTWSHTSTGDHSPRCNTESFGETIIEYPLITFINQMPYSTANVLCTLVSKIPTKLQQKLLGHISTGFSFIETPHYKDHTMKLFSTLEPSIGTELNTLTFQLECLRKYWPDYLTWDDCDDPTVISDCLLRQIYILKRHLRILYGFSIPWVIPEVWDCWQSLQNISDDIIEFLIFCSKSYKDSDYVSKILALLLIQVQWTITKLFDIQNSDICAV